MTLPKYSLCYERCFDQELHDFIKQRRIKGAHTDRKSSIELLRKADQEASFRFLDLPPEIRNIIYGDILTPRLKDEDTVTCHPAILASGRLVDAEAAEILHSTTAVLVTLTLDTYDPFRRPWLEHVYYNVEAKFNGRVISRGTRGEPKARVNWPSCLAKLRYIDLEVAIHHPRAIEISRDDEDAGVK